jgi:hypothetical protein
MTVIDHLTRMAHFLTCTKSVTTKETTNLVLHGVYKLHGLPCVLVSDRDPKFVSGLRHALWRRLGTRLNMSSSRHPGTDGLTERVNSFYFVSVAMMDPTSQTYCLKWKLRITLLGHLELSTPPSRFF